jgi:DNA-binding beta-propeller fold protein YncE
MSGSGGSEGVGERVFGSRWLGRHRPFDALGMAALVLLVAAACVLTIGGAPALAATGHRFLSSISEAPAGTVLKEPSAAVVDHTSGRVFVADPAGGGVDVFGSNGGFQTRLETPGPVAVAVDEAAGEVYVADSFLNAVVVYKPNGSGGYERLSEWRGAGAPGEEFGEVVGVAVDNSTSASDPGAGDVYVADRENSTTESGAVDVFKPAGPGEHKEGEFQRTLSGVKLEAPNGVAVNSATGKVYVAESVKGAVYEFSSSGAFESKFTGSGSPLGSFRGVGEEEGNVTAVAVDETTGDLLVAEAERHVVSELSEAGKWVGWVTGTPSGPFGEPRGVAVASSGDLYIADAASHVVDVFGPGVVVPDVKTTTASKRTRTTAVLGGVINGDGKPAHYHFEWGESEALGSSTPLQSAGVGEEKVSAELSGLKAGTSYFFRLVGENENGTNFGAIHEFTTSPAVEALSTGLAQAITPSGATLTGTLTPGGVDAHYYFEWGLTSEYAEKSPVPPGTDAGSGAEAVPAKTELGGLSANTTYHYRLVGTNEFGTTRGEDAQFTTSGPPQITNEATTGVGHETATIKARVNPDQLATVYHFEYGESPAYGTEVPLGGASIGSGSEPVAVSASLSGLKLGVTYHFRVVATNSAGSTAQPDQTFTTIPPALVDSTSASEVSSTGAKLLTEVNPLGHDTTVYFQYGTSSCKANPAGCTNIPAPPGTDIGSGEADQSATARAQELKPGTTYFYRVLATNSLGTGEGPEHTFTTQSAASPSALPDGRAWEMVSPPDKGGAPVEALTREGGLILASEDGNTFTYVVNGALGEEAQGNRSPEWQQVLARRGEHGWGSQDITTPNTTAKGITPGATPQYQYFSADLSRALVQPTQLGVDAEPPLAPGVTQATMYLRDDTSGTYLPLVTEGNVAPGTVFGGQLQFVGGTPGLSHVVIASQVALSGPSSAPGLYEWTGGALQLLSLLPGGAPAKGLVELGYANVAANAISTDGTRIIWTTAESERSGHLYMRDTASGETVQLDAAQGVGEPGGAGTAHFQTASGDGSRVFFTDQQRLTPDSTAEALPPRPDLYECEMVEQNNKLTCKLTDLTVDHNAGEHANVQGLVFGTSQDGTSTYLVAQGVLATNENGKGEKAVNANDNLYELLYDAGQRTTTFIATLSSEDSPEWEGNRIANTAYVTARVSPRGRYLAFMSNASLTGYDNTDTNPEAKGARDEEVYLYDAANASVRCVSCNPTGARPTGVLDAEGVGEGLGRLVDRRKVWVGHWLAANIPGWTAENLTSALVQSRYLSDAGRLFFDSPDSLVAQASNHKENVYEYEPAGLGSCQSPSGACVSLISSGSSGKESAFLEATPDGSSVFFITAAQLLPQDTDTAFDIYDARICTQASPCLTPPVPVAGGCSTANACRPASPSQQAPLATSGSATLAGSTDVAQPQPRQQAPGAKGAKPKSLTRAQQLARALRACRKQHSHKKRAACERHARKLYGAKAAGKSKTTAAKARLLASRRSSARRGR